MTSENCLSRQSEPPKNCDTTLNTLTFAVYVPFVTAKVLLCVCVPHFQLASPPGYKITYQYIPKISDRKGASTREKRTRHAPEERIA